MLFITLIFVVVQCVLAVISPNRCIVFSLWTQTIPYTWNWDTQLVYETPIGPLNVTAMQLFGFCLACLLALLTRLPLAAEQLRFSRWHAVFIGFCLLSLIWASSGAYGFRMVAKLLGPFLFLTTVLTVVNTESVLRQMRIAILGSGVILVILALYARAIGADSDPNAINTGLAGLGPPSMGPPVFSAHMLPVAMLAFALFIRKPNLPMLLMTTVSALAIIAALQRTSAGALYLGFAAILFFGTGGMWRIFLPAAGIVCVPALMIFNSTFRKRMFYGDATSDTLLADPSKALSSVNSSGRFDLWGSMLQRYFDPHPAVGSGAGATQDYFYSHGGGGVIHSEYVRLLCEVGVAGLTLFAVTMFSYFWRVRRSARTPGGAPFRVSISLAATGALVSYAVYCSTDNAFDYVTQFGIYVFGLAAMAIKYEALVKVECDSSEARDFSGLPFPNLLR
jgi:hypothetical protein